MGGATGRDRSCRAPRSKPRRQRRLAFPGVRFAARGGGGIETAVKGRAAVDPQRTDCRGCRWPPFRGRLRNGCEERPAQGPGVRRLTTAYRAPTAAPGQHSRPRPHPRADALDALQGAGGRPAPAPSSPRKGITGSWPGAWCGGAL